MYERNLFRPASFAYYIHTRRIRLSERLCLDNIVRHLSVIAFYNTCTVFVVGSTEADNLVI